MQRQTEALTELLAAGPALVVTGAGISTDSGIPDYRDASGRMRHVSPMTYQRFVGSHDERRRYWARSHLGWPRIAAARPNASHRAVTALQAAGHVRGVVTQNVDGLHTAAGTAGVIDLHGRLDAVACLDCDVRRPRLELGLRLDAVNPGFRERVAAGARSHRPDGDVVIAEDVVAGFRVVACRRCEGVLKPDVVFFGEHVPSERFRAALGLLDRSAALLVLGSSLMVGSGFRFVTAARRRGLPIAIVSRGVTRGDALAAIKVDASLGRVLPAVAEALADPPARHATLPAG
ncbi:NAD-dependent protein deacetylase [Egicoccus sp. AB-alg6-2]|uniref:NAD-dependent protein deacetylase n=1 Tax=Egicoccus sp. AB-alg6-2 TaxID=3242692 RepID=UPI00359E7385